MANISAALRYSELWKPASEIKVLPEENRSEPLMAQSLSSILPVGIKRGDIAEISGPRSAGSTALYFHLLATATARGEICAVVDSADVFDPASAVAAGVQLERLVWVRCGGHLEHAMRAVDLLLHAGGFGFVCLDLCEAHPRHLNRIPLSYWHRFRYVLENTSTVLLVCARFPQAKSSSSVRLQAKLKAISWLGTPPFSRLAGVETNAAPGKVLSIRPQTLFLKATA